MVKWTEYCYKRWLWTFGALAELDVVVANIRDLTIYRTTTRRQRLKTKSKLKRNE